MKPKLIVNAILVSLFVLGGSKSVIGNTRGDNLDTNFNKDGDQGLIERLLSFGDRFITGNPEIVSISRSETVIEDLADGNYSYCSESSYRDDSGEWCFDFVKSRQKIVGNYFFRTSGGLTSVDTPTVCVEGTAKDNSITGVGYKKIGYGAKRPDIGQEKEAILRSPFSYTENSLGDGNLTTFSPSFYRLIEPENPNLDDQTYSAWVRFQQALFNLDNFDSVASNDFKPVTSTNFIGYKRNHRCLDKNLDADRRVTLIPRLLAFGGRKTQDKPKITSTSQPGITLANLNNGNYRYCADSNHSNDNREWCFDFVKTRKKIVGNYFYRVPSNIVASVNPVLGTAVDKPMMCIEGTVEGNSVKGIGYKMVEYGKERPDIEQAKKTTPEIPFDESDKSFTKKSLTAFSPNFHRLIEPENPNLFEPIYFAWIRYDEVAFDLDNFEPVKAADFKTVKATSFIGYKVNYRCIG